MYRFSKDTAHCNLGERIARLEGNEPHLVTKADISDMQATLTWRMVIAVSIATAILGLLIRVP